MYHSESTWTPVEESMLQRARGSLTVAPWLGKWRAARRSSSLKGEAMRIEIAWRDKDRRLTLRLAAGARMLPPGRRRIAVRLAGTKVSKAVVFEGRPVELRL